MLPSSTCCLLCLLTISGAVLVLQLLFMVPFPLQIEELLKEVTLKETKKKKIDAFLHEINSLLSAIPETSESDVGPRGLGKAVRTLYVAGSAEDRASSPWEPPLGTEKILPCFTLAGSSSSGCWCLPAQGSAVWEEGSCSVPICSR